MLILWTFVLLFIRIYMLLDIPFFLNHGFKFHGESALFATALFWEDFTVRIWSCSASAVGPWCYVGWIVLEHGVRNHYRCCRVDKLDIKVYISECSVVKVPDCVAQRPDTLVHIYLKKVMGRLTPWKRSET